jgi:hypothetical protein
MDEGVGSSEGAPGPADAEIARLTEERDRLQSELGELRGRPAGEARPAGRPRRVVAVALVVVTSIVFTVTVVGVWARRNALNTDRWVTTVGPVADDPAVQDALGRWMTTELMDAIDPEAFFENALPERGQILAVPLTNALRGFVNDRVDSFLASDTFHELWLAVNERAHTRVVAVLEGDTGNLQVEDGNVVLNLVPVLNQLLARIGEASPEIFGRTVDLPTITVDDIPEEAVARIESALGRELPQDFGRFTVFEARRLQQAQDAVDLFNRLVVVSVILAIGLIALTLWVSPHRRRTLVQLAVGIALGVVLIRRLGIRLEDDVVDLARPENQDAVRVVVGAFVSSLLDATAWILAIAAVVAAVAVLTGPYGWAEALRRRTVSLARSLAAVVGAAVTRRPDEPTVAWVAAHREVLQIGGIVVGIIVLLAADLSWLGLLLLALVIGGFELVVHRMSQLAPAEVPQPPPVGPVNVGPADGP